MLNSELFRFLKRMRSVQRVDGWNNVRESAVSFVFYFCPRMKSSGFWLNPSGTGLDAKYVPGVSGFSAQRIARVKRFQQELSSISGGELISITAIFASADSAILFPQPVQVPQTPSAKEVGFPVVENLTAFLAYKPAWESCYQDRPWEENSPPHVQDGESKRLRGLLGSVPSFIADDFVRRAFAGFALDGLILRGGDLGLENPVILGVESPGVPILQNAALHPSGRIAIVQLK